MTLALDYAARSDRGLVRANNEDSAVAATHLLALADGMGGHAAGEVASQLMVSELFPLNALFSAEDAEDIPPERLSSLLFEAMEAGNRAIAAHVDENPTLEGMGCTLSSLLFNDGAVGLCHVGDSRGYVLRDGVLTQITKDDTFVQSLVDEGKLAAEDVSSHPQRSLILKALTGRPVEPALKLLTARAGDRYMLCSDGLSDPVSAETICDVLGEGTPTAAAAKLIDLALRGGGPDNVTVVVADVVDTDARAASDDAPELPTAVALAGAIDTGATELPRPDTAAGRAMSVNVVNRTSSVTNGNASAAPSGNNASSSKDASDGSSESASAASRTSPRRRWLLTIATIVLVLIVVLGAGAWFAKRSLDDSFFVAVSAGEDIPAPATNPATASASGSPSASAPSSTTTAPSVGPSSLITAPALSAAPTLDAASALAAKGTPILIYQGAPEEFFGISLNSVYQEICLNEDAEIRLLPAGSTDSCHRFSTADLTPAARGSLDNLPRDSYQSIQEQLRRLAEQTLPICVTRSSGDAGGTGRAGEADTAVDDNPADLTTPGVSCREVN